MLEKRTDGRNIGSPKNIKKERGKRKEALSKFKDEIRIRTAYKRITYRNCEGHMRKDGSIEH